MENDFGWLLLGDVSVQYLTHKLLLGSGEETLFALRRRIETEGFGAAILSRRNPGGHWGIWFYQRKWTCTHYTLADLKNLGINPSCAPCREMVLRAFNECMLGSGGINFAKTLVQSDICVDGMFLNYAAYFCPEEERIWMLTDFILSHQHSDGGFGWNADADDSDPHTTICVLEGLRSAGTAAPAGLGRDARDRIKRAEEYLLERQLLYDDDAQYRRLSYPYRYRYDLLRSLEYFADAGYEWDRRMQPALDWMLGKRGKDGVWPLEHMHKGREHLVMEETGAPSRFITLKAQYILSRLKPHDPGK